jgi:putative peptidoglycan lipid II flippase
MAASNNTENNSGHVQVMRAAGLVGAAFLVSRIVGLVRNIIKASYLGLGIGATAYDTASRFPEAIFLIIAGGAIGSAFIPTFSAYFARDDEAGGWRLFAAVINLVTVVVTAVALLTIIFARQFVIFFLHELVMDDPALLDLTVQLMRIMLLSSIIFGASGVVMGALNARQHFLLPALAPIVYNLGIIIGAVVGKPPEVGMAWGTVGGALGHLLIQMPGLRQKGAKYSAVFTLRHPGVQQVLRLMAPRVLGLSFSEVNKFATVYLSGFISAASVPALLNAWQIMIMPQGILGQALAIAAFPTLATLAARSALDEMRQILSSSLRLLLFLGLPATIFLMLLRRPIITILLERGRFLAGDTELVAWALLFYAIGLIALTSLEVISRTFYALSDTLTPVLVGGLQAIVMVGLSQWLSATVFPARGWEALGGVALGTSLANFLEVVVLLELLRRKMGGLNGRVLLDGLWRMGTATILMAGSMWLVIEGLAQSSIWWQALLGTFVGTIAYLGGCFFLRVEEVEQFIGYGRRLWRRLTGK